jgi:hypothetical protein
MSRVVIAFDGSPSARVALERAGELFPGAHATVVSVAQGVRALAEASGAARAALPDEVIRTAIARLRESALTDAQELAEAACRDAADAGLRAESRTVAAERSVWSAILDAVGESRRGRHRLRHARPRRGGARRPGIRRCGIGSSRAAAGARRARGDPLRFRAGARCIRWLRLVRRRAPGGRPALPWTRDARAPCLEVAAPTHPEWRRDEARPSAGGARHRRRPRPPDRGARPLNRRSLDRCPPRSSMRRTGPSWSPLLDLMDRKERDAAW